MNHQAVYIHIASNKFFCFFIFFFLGAGYPLAASCCRYRRRPVPWSTPHPARAGTPPRLPHPPGARARRRKELHISARKFLALAPLALSYHFLPCTFPGLLTSRPFFLRGGFSVSAIDCRGRPICRLSSLLTAFLVFLDNFIVCGKKLT